MPDVHHLAELTTDGTLHVWDLETHRVLYERMYQRRRQPGVDRPAASC